MVKNRSYGVRKGICDQGLRLTGVFPAVILFRVLKVDNLSDRRDKHVLHLMYKIAHEMTPGEFLKYFAPKEYHYGLRNVRKCFDIPKLFLTGELKIGIKYPSK